MRSTGHSLGRKMDLAMLGSGDQHKRHVGRSDEVDLRARASLPNPVCQARFEVLPFHAGVVLVDQR